ncbi:MAG: hypothetical protein COV71_01530 [Candidatus Omnitrophica bacterium CG11_big_fil_rev_8_21_14_0_20_41_12]|nr:MAG: hypothetical protein COV71_01530 [Candidatus Omnitrophica bacterium CG11_big_fil_rev_8_21_14_0_20_41_12]
MLNYLEKLVRIIYREKKNSRGSKLKDHPNEESLACFLEDKLSAADKDVIIKHLLSCDRCAEYLSVQLKIQPHLSLDVPVPLLEKVKKLVNQEAGGILLEIFLKLKDKAIEIIQTTGDVLVGQELIPAPVLRSRQVNEFKEEVCILKDLQQIRVLAKIQNKDHKSFNLTISVKDKQSQKIPQDLRITLIKGGVELESYLVDSGSSYFENILPGNYTVEISRQGQKEALIDLKVRP